MKKKLKIRVNRVQTDSLTLTVDADSFKAAGKQVEKIGVDVLNEFPNWELVRREFEIVDIDYAEVESSLSPEAA